MAVVRPIEPDEIDAAIDLVRDVFEEYVRPDLEDAGWAKLLEYVDADAARNRAADHLMLGAFDGERLAGVIEIRHFRHISLLVVEKRSFRKGIARQLLESGVTECRVADPELEYLTVHASRYAMSAYRRLGFVETADEMVVDGIRFTPMSKSLR